MNQPVCGANSADADASPQCPTSLAGEYLVETPLAIGSREIPTRYFLAPLAGYTHHAFRTTIRELGGLGLATTDLIPAASVLSQKGRAADLLATSPDDQPLSIQIYGGITADLAAAARWLEARGYGGVDLNMGCPMAKINGQGGGARLMCDVDGAVATVSRLVESVSIPVTVKMRLGWDRTAITAPILAREFERAGAAAVTIHGRTRAQGFQGTVDLEGIRRTVEAVERIPVIGNGDVRTPADALRMRRETGCAAVAIGRGALLDPWIFHKLRRWNAGNFYAWEPAGGDRIRFLIRHFRGMWARHQAYSCTLFRKFAGWYGATLGIPEDLEDRLRRFESQDEFDAIVAEIRMRQGERRSFVPTALVKVPNGPVERW